MNPSTVAAAVTRPGQFALDAARSLARIIAPQGGQHVSRRNAWQAMSADLRLAHARKDAEAEMRRLITTQRHESDERPAALSH